eukprot:16449582-Heterocapsa_arctica.AAC.1
MSSRNLLTGRIWTSAPYRSRTRAAIISIVPSMRGTSIHHIARLGICGRRCRARRACRSGRARTPYIIADVCELPQSEHVEMKENNSI